MLTRYPHIRLRMMLATIIQCLPKVSEHPREPYVKRSFSRRSHESSFRRKATNFCLELVM